MNNRKKYFWFALLFFLLFSCEKKAEDVRFSTPGKTYDIWLRTAIEGDYAANIECLTKASRKFTDSQAKQRMVFMERMVGSAKVYKNYDIVGENIKGDRAVVIIREPKSGDSIAIPFQYEEGGWKVDLIAMFSGFVQGAN